MQDTLLSIKECIERAGGLVQELDELVQYQLLQSEKRRKDGKPKVSHSAWLKESSNLQLLQKGLEKTRLDLVLMLTALNSIQQYVLLLLYDLGRTTCGREHKVHLGMRLHIF